MPDDLVRGVNELIEAVNVQALHLADLLSKVDALTMDVSACIDVCDAIKAVQARGLQVPILGVVLPAEEKRKNGHG